jgi:hypothetical protein
LVHNKEVTGNHLFLRTEHNWQQQTEHTPERQKVSTFMGLPASGGCSLRGRTTVPQHTHLVLINRNIVDSQDNISIRPMLSAYS